MISDTNKEKIKAVVLTQEEIDKEYFEAQEKRFQQFKSQLKMFV